MRISAPKLAFSRIPQVRLRRRTKPNVNVSVPTFAMKASLRDSTSLRNAPPRPPTRTPSAFLTMSKRSRSTLSSVNKQERALERQIPSLPHLNAPKVALGAETGLQMGTRSQPLSSCINRCIVQALRLSSQHVFNNKERTHRGRSVAHL